jgi:hypothetical protein
MIIGNGELGKNPAERMASLAIDPLNLIRVMPAKGRRDEAPSQKAIPTLFARKKR